MFTRVAAAKKHSLCGALRYSLPLLWQFSNTGFHFKVPPPSLKEEGGRVSKNRVEKEKIGKCKKHRQYGSFPPGLHKLRPVNNEETGFSGVEAN